MTWCNKGTAILAGKMSYLSPDDSNQRMCFHGWVAQFHWYIADWIPNNCSILHNNSFKTALNVPSKCCSVNSLFSFFRCTLVRKRMVPSSGLYSAAPWTWNFLIDSLLFYWECKTDLDVYLAFSLNVLSRKCLHLKLAALVMCGYWWVCRQHMDTLTPFTCSSWQSCFACMYRM